VKQITIGFPRSMWDCRSRNFGEQLIYERPADWIVSILVATDTDVVVETRAPPESLNALNWRRTA
jgi:hypothetical protein